MIERSSNVHQAPWCPLLGSNLYFELQTRKNKNMLARIRPCQKNEATVANTRKTSSLKHIFNNNNNNNIYNISVLVMVTSLKPREIFNREEGTAEFIFMPTYPQASGTGEMPPIPFQI